MATIIPSICTEQQALAYAAQYPELVFYTSDTHKIIRGENGTEYGNNGVNFPLIYQNGSVSLTINTDKGVNSDANGLFVNPTYVSSEIFITNMNEDDAVTDSQTNTDNVYLTTDTRAIVKGGNVYGHGNAITTPFQFAEDTQLQSSWDTTKLYLVKTATDGTFTLYAYDGSAWSSYGTQSLTVTSSASQITYSRDKTPGLGDGDVQSAIEALYTQINDSGIRRITEWTDYRRSIRKDGFQFYYLYEGAAMPAWENTTNVPAVSNSIEARRVAQRGARIEVNEGDALLLDVVGWSHSNGIVFTDTSNMIVEIPENGDSFIRKGLYVAPCDGFAYIQDVLYSDDNYIFRKEYTYLAKELMKKSDEQTVIPCEINLTKMDLPFVINTTATAATYTKILTAGGVYTSFYTPTPKQKYDNFFFTYLFMHIKVGANHTAGGTITSLFHRDHLTSWSINNQKTITSLNDLAGDEDGIWVAQVAYNGCGLYRQDSGAHRTMCNENLMKLSLGSLTIDGMIDLTIDDAFLTRDMDLSTWAYWIYFTEKFTKYKPVNGRLVLPKREITQEWRMLSLTSLGYDCFDKGERPPLRGDGLKNAIALRASAPSISGTAYNKFNGNTTIHYLHDLDVSLVTTSTVSMFNGCGNLKTVTDLNFPNLTCSTGSMFRGCSWLKKIGSLGGLVSSSSGSRFTDCRCLKQIVGPLVFNLPTSHGLNVGEFVNCFQLKRIEEMDFTNYRKYDTSSMAYNFFTTYNNNWVPTLRYMLIKNFGTQPGFVGFTFRHVTWWGVNSFNVPDAKQSLIDTLLTYSFDRAAEREAQRQAYIADALGTVIGVYADGSLPETATSGDLALVTGSADVMTWNGSAWAVSRTAVDGDKYATATSAYAWDATNSAWVQWTNPYPNCTVDLRSYTYDQLTAEERASITAKGYTLTRYVAG